MIRIAVCDDDFQTTEQIEQLLLMLQKNVSEKIEVAIYYSGESFAKVIRDGCPFDIVLMDIEMKGMDGIQAGHLLRSNVDNDSVQMIYISSHEQYHVQLFDVQPSGFIRKPFDQEIFQSKLIPALQRVMAKRQQTTLNFLPIQKQGRELLIPVRNILYLESKARKVLLFTRSEQIEYYSTLNEEEQKLRSGRFMRIHQSYIINFYFVKEISYKKVLLVTGKELPISENKSASVKKMYVKFRGDLLA